MSLVLYCDNIDINHSKWIELRWKRTHKLNVWFTWFDAELLSRFSLSVWSLIFKNINWLLFVQLFRNVMGSCREWKMLLYCTYSRSI